MTEIGFTRGTWSTAVRKARRFACKRNETVRFFFNQPSGAWVFYVGGHPNPKRASGVTAVPPTHCKKGRRR